MNGKRRTDAARDVASVHVTEGLGPVGVKRGSRRCVPSTQLNDSGYNTEDGANPWVARAAMTYSLVPHAILLAGKREGDERSRLKVGYWARGVVKGSRPHPQTDVLEAEQVI